jgi:hypothetical protein
VCKAHEPTSNADTTVFRPPHEAELLSESKELNVNFQDLESFLADPDPHDLMAICPRHRQHQCEAAQCSVVHLRHLALENQQQAADEGSALFSPILRRYSQDLQTQQENLYGFD